MAESLAEPRGDVIWSDEFVGPEGTSPAAHWRILEGGVGWGDGELQAYTARPENVALDGDGHLRITALREGDGSYTSARLESVPSFTHGILEARVMVPGGQGLWSAFWTLGQDHETVGWPNAGEIDVMEVMNDTALVHANVHIEDRGERSGRWQSPGRLTPPRPVAGEWHVYGVRWSAEELVFTFDGQEYHRVTRADVEGGGERRWPFDDPQRLLLNLAVGGSWPGDPDEATPFPSSMLVDYVRVRPLDTGA